ncbi:MAG: glycoside hydrolase family 43 protein [Candidatus Dormibacteria bacterium]
MELDSRTAPRTNERSQQMPVLHPTPHRQRSLLRRAAVTCALVAGCSALLQAPQPAPAYPQSGPAVAPALQPLIHSNCPDPSLLSTSHFYLLSCTGSSSGAFPLRESSTLHNWHKSPVTYAFPLGHAPAWSSGGYWAPEIHEIGGQYVMYFTAATTIKKRCIGVATSSTPTGPYTSAGILQCGIGSGAIDPSVLRTADGTLYLYWKSDGNSNGKPTGIFVQRLANDGLRTTSHPIEVLHADESWTNGIVEGPSVVEHDGWYYLFYSGNKFATPSYAEGVARARTPFGPFAPNPTNPILSSSNQWYGPGGGSVVHADGSWYLVYHAFPHGEYHGKRYPFLAPIAWNVDGWPSIVSPHGLP